ncbi:RHS repeat domain-containing protein [Paraburkholderia rhizosphaerae]|uniref:YD repeat-containing protein n=1 Tax=Paraburkholderia rhizosphaerae TaxID=480658 RepID=A0A4R8LML2_9BURK|nr:RHS repeat domain-containing protein [Paraburkholderia rhizosphaerae]TDY46570.1 YD repeat-containing protein [Paraburkholderia rhizosphaerae]
MRGDHTEHTVTNSYDRLGQLTQTSAAGRTLRYTRDAAGNVTDIAWPDGFHVATTYDSYRRPGAAAGKRHGESGEMSGASVSGPNNSQSSDQATQKTTQLKNTNPLLHPSPNLQAF